MLRAGDLESWHAGDQIMHVDPLIEEKHRRTRLRGGELLLSVVGNPGTARVASPDFVGMNVARAIAVLRFESVEASWLALCFKSAPVQHQLRSLLNTTVQATLNLADIRTVRVPLPGKKTREGIIEVLGALDDKIAANQNIAIAVSALQHALWQSHSTRAGLRSLLDFAEPHLGGTPPRSDSGAWDGQVPWASVKDMSAAQHGVLIETGEGISQEVSRGSRRLNALPSGSTFLSARGTVGLVTTNAMDCAINQSAYAFVPQTGQRTLLRLALESAVSGLQARSHGSVFNTITMQTLKESKVPDISDPSLMRVGVELDALESRRIRACTEVSVLAATRDELLPLLMSGKITVTDAEKRVEQEV